MSQTLETAPPPVERTAEPPRKSLLTILLERPEIGALVAAVAIFVFFFAVAPPFRSLAAFSTVLYDSSTIGIMAVGVALLMIGGEFDLSAGVAVITAALTAAMLSYEHIMRHLAAASDEELRDLGIRAEREPPLETFLRRREEARRRAHPR